MRLIDAMNVTIYLPIEFCTTRDVRPISGPTNTRSQRIIQSSQDFADHL